MEELRKYLEELTEREAVFDDEDAVIYDWFGSNVDDAYWGGVEDGKVSLARTLLEKFVNDAK